MSTTDDLPPLSPTDPPEAFDARPVHPAMERPGSAPPRRKWWQR